MILFRCAARSNHIAVRWALAAVCVVCGINAGAQSLDAPNIVAISSTLVTSGQPSRQALLKLGQSGFQAVIYLAPSTVPDAVKDEAQLISRQGIEFVHIPVPFNAPEQSHFEALSAALDRLKSRKVLVHCQVNMRASSMVFLHRAIRDKEDPSLAYDAVTKIWSPDGVWRKFLVTQLRRHEINFDPY